MLNPTRRDFLAGLAAFTAAPTLASAQQKPSLLQIDATREWTAEEKAKYPDVTRVQRGTSVRPVSFEFKNLQKADAISINLGTDSLIYTRDASTRGSNDMWTGVDGNGNTASIVINPQTGNVRGSFVAENNAFYSIIPLEKQQVLIVGDTTIGIPTHPLPQPGITPQSTPKFR